jgi:hypothetical protein
VTPSDFALVVRNIPLDITKERLVQLVEDRFSRSKVKVAYVNMCYNIEDIFKANSKITELAKMKGFYKLHLKKEMKARGIKKRQMLQQPEMVDPPMYRYMLVMRKQLNLSEIEREIKENQAKIQQYSKNLEPGGKADLFIGVAIVVVQSEQD